jgi:hypothetical protein
MNEKLYRFTNLIFFFCWIVLGTLPLSSCFLSTPPAIIKHSCVRFDTRGKFYQYFNQDLLTTTINLHLVYTSKKRNELKGFKLYHREREKGKHDDDDDNDEQTTTIMLVDLGLLATDFIAIILASQLIGLLDIINDPEFIRDGGWLQPIPTVPSTLGNLVRRSVTLCVLWIIATVTRNGLSQTTESICETTTQSSFWTKQEWMLLAIFCVLRVAVLGVGTSFEKSELYDLIMESFRECYILGLFTFALRFLYNQYYIQ